ncbi:MAG: helix-turn-helix transcriptional regulator [Lachnospiraceae bacterium]|nr:helix-turn-helix transcriptional regulator [Lachnospiraceae bacterium]
MNFAEKLLNLRTEYGYSQETLAEKLNVSRQAVSKWESGATLPETDKIITLSNFFGVSTDYLLKDNIQRNTQDSLDRVVLKFLGSAKDMDNISEELVDIMRDGIIDDEEKVKMESIIETLDTISQIISEIKSKINMQ